MALHKDFHRKAARVKDLTHFARINRVRAGMALYVEAMIGEEA